MPTQTKNARSSRAEAKPRAGGPSPAKSASASPRGSGAGGTAESPASSAPAPTAPSKASRSRQSPAKKLTDLPSTGCPADTPTRSGGAVELGAKGRSVMRSVALDLGVKKIAYCEVSAGEVIDRRMVSSLSSLEPTLGPGAKPARVAIEACREAWFVHATLTACRRAPEIAEICATRRRGVVGPAGDGIGRSV